MEKTTCISLSGIWINFCPIRLLLSFLHLITESFELVLHTICLVFLYFTSSKNRLGAISNIQLHLGGVGLSTLSTAILYYRGICCNLSDSTFCSNFLFFFFSVVLAVGPSSSGYPFCSDDLQLFVFTVVSTIFSIQLLTIFILISFLMYMVASKHLIKVRYEICILTRGKKPPSCVYFYHIPLMNYL